MKTVVIISNKHEKFMLEFYYKIVIFPSACEYLNSGNLCDLVLLCDTDLDLIAALNIAPVIVLDEKYNFDNEIKALQLGAADYIHKPVNLASLKSRIDTHISNFEHKNGLEKIIFEKTKTIEKLSDVTIESIISIIGTRDTDTNNHSGRTSEYVLAIANELKNSGLYQSELSEENIFMLKKSAPLHDIGKVGIDDTILKKLGKYTPEEFEIMKNHTIIGSEALKRAKLFMNEPSFLDCAEILARHHHEKWDGSGYPDKLKANEIPLFARIMAIADVYDALTSKRSYKEMIPHNKSVEIITQGSGTQFDPDICNAFLRINQKFFEISKKLLT